MDQSKHSYVAMIPNIYHRMGAGELSQAWIHRTLLAPGNSNDEEELGNFMVCAH